jgi:peptidyl-prolyl cis-trans isomerase SurA
MTKPVFRLIALLFVLTSLFAATPAQAQSDGEVVDEIAAVVGEDVILRSEVNAIMQNAMRRNPQLSGSKKERWMNFLNELVNQKVLAVHGKRDTTITVSSDQVDRLLDRRIERMTQRMGGEAQLEKMQGQSIEEIRAEFRPDFREQALAQRFRSTKLRDVSVTPSEVRDWYENVPKDSLPELPDAVRLSHIVRYPKPSEQAREQARDVISNIRDSVVNGTSTFEEMARRFSEDQNSASSGGRIQDISQGELLPEFAAVATRLEEEQVSQVFETPQGFHIMRLNERRGDVIDLNHILIKIEERSSDSQAARDFLAAVRDSIVSWPATFEEMARRHSEQKTSARRGGQVMDPRSQQRDLQLKRLNPGWQQTIRNLDAGDVSTPQKVQLLNGDEAYHIVRLESYEPAHRMSLETDYDRIRKLALRDKRQRIYQQWLKKLREDVYVDVRIEPDDLSLAQL